jgi:hypothetical protein
MNGLDTDVNGYRPPQTIPQETVVPAYGQKVALRCLETDGKTFVVCETDLYLCPSSPEFAHGPLIMRYVSTGTERILEEKERMSVVTRVRFRKVVRQNLQVVVYDCAHQRDRPPDNASVTGAFLTSSGRQLAFYCLSLSSKKIMRRAGLNTLVTDLILPMHFRIGGGVCRFKLNSGAMGKYPDSNVNEGPMAIYVLMELAILLIIHYQNGFSSRKRWYLLLGKLENLEIPETWADALNNGIELELQQLSKRASPTLRAFSLLQFGLSLPPVINRSRPLKMTLFGTESLHVMNRVLGVNRL